MINTRTISLLLSLLASPTLDRAPARADFGDPLGGLTDEELARFEAGKEVFEEEETPADGLGPVFNARSCAACHNVGATGGGSTQTETRFGSTASGKFDPLEDLGGPVIQQEGIGVASTCEFVGEVVPADANIQAGRRATALFGLGLVESVPDERLRAIAAMQQRLLPAIAGRPHVVMDVVSGQQRVGRFGWKSQVATLPHFAAEAYLNEMGITTPLFPAENCPNGNCALLDCDPVPDPEDDGDDADRFADFMRLLAPPPSAVTLARTDRRINRRGVTRRRGRTESADQIDGSRLFDRIGCAGCHVRTLTTGESEIAALRAQRFHPFSDFLLHDMGALGDGIVQGEAAATEMRTAPLWGLRLQTTFLHDGRATTLADAILAHDGQARDARNRFAALDGRGQAQLLRFLGNL